MQNPIRRIVTGRDAQGRSTVTSDTALSPTAVPHDLYLWTTGAPPAAGADGWDAAKVPQRLEPPRGGSVFRMLEFPPMAAMAGLSAAQVEAFFTGLFDGMGASHCRVDTRRGPGMHTTATVDYAVLVRGELTLVLDDGEVTLKPGDTVVQRGTNHDWVNRGDEPALIAVVMLDAPAATGTPN